MKWEFRFLVAHGGLLLLAAVSAPAQPPVVPEDVKMTVRQRVDYGYCPGIVVGLMNTNGSTYFSYGSTDLDEGPSVDEHTLFEIGSLTKVFTTTLLTHRITGHSPLITGHL